MEATEQLQQKGQELQQRLGTQIEEAKRNLQDLNQRITEFVRKRPGACLLGALAFGFVVGRIAARR
jgi:ElaB/YqjD/DUF883 family membrane-anchored ribosome-binding protein